MNVTSLPLVKIGARHQVTIPKAIVERAALKPGEYVVFSIEASKIVMAPKAVVDRPDAWFWSKEWQAKERAADEAISRGATIGPFKTARAALRALKTAKV